MVNSYDKHGMIVDKFHEIISPTQSKGLEKYVIFNTQKRDKPENDFEKDFNKVPKN